MVVLSVLYPNEPGLHFDLAYYRDVHLPLVRRLLGPAGLRSLAFHRPVETDPNAAFQLVAQLRFDDMATMRAALSAHGAEADGDIPNFTDARPLFLAGEEIAA